MSRHHHKKKKPTFLQSVGEALKKGFKEGSKELGRTAGEVKYAVSKPISSKFGRKQTKQLLLPYRERFMMAKDEIFQTHSMGAGINAELLARKYNLPIQVIDGIHNEFASGEYQESEFAPENFAEFQQKRMSQFKMPKQLPLPQRRLRPRQEFNFAKLSMPFRI